jgi:hypothetical protein
VRRLLKAGAAAHRKLRWPELQRLSLYVAPGFWDLGRYACFLHRSKRSRDLDPGVCAAAVKLSEAGIMPALSEARTPARPLPCSLALHAAAAMASFKMAA